MRTLQENILGLQNNTIEILSISGGKIGDENARKIATVLRENTSIEKIDLSDKEISEAGIEAILSVIKNNRLTELDLRGNKIGDNVMVDWRGN